MDSQEIFHNEEKFPVLNMERLQIYSDTNRCNITKADRCNKKLTSILAGFYQLPLRHLTEAHKLDIWPCSTVNRDHYKTI